MEIYILTTEDLLQLFPNKNSKVRYVPTRSFELDICMFRLLNHKTTLKIHMFLLLGQTHAQEVSTLFTYLWE